MHNENRRQLRTAAWGEYMSAQKTRYDSLDLSFSLDGGQIRILNLVFEQFQHTIPAHAHGENCYEIHYIPYGRGCVRMNNTTLPLSSGSVYVTGPYIEHEQTIHADDPMAEYCVYLRIERLPKATAQATISQFAQVPLWAGKDSQNLKPLFEQLFRELELEQIGYLNAVKAILVQLLIAMVRNYQRLPASKDHLSSPVFSQGSGPLYGRSPGASGSLLAERQSLILEESFLYDYAELTLEDLSQRIGLSPRQTQRILREQYEQSFQQKRTQARMAAAASFLTDTNLSISAIADRTGYSCAEHFAAAFRRYWNKSPREYRNQTK